MQLRFDAVTHTGRVRKLNEDSILSLPDQNVWLVADGMGGHEAGDLASRIVVDRVSMLQPNLPPAEKMQALRETIDQAHDAIRAESEARGGAMIGTTVVAFLAAGDHFVTFWAGDSRLYLLRNGTIELLTTDHSVVGEMVAAGQLTWDEADAHPNSNQITRAVGHGEALELEKIRGKIERGDRYLLCSDGLNKHLGFSQIAELLTRERIETVATSLVETALQMGGEDNVSVIVVEAC